MKKQHIHQEVLVSKGSTLAKKVLYEISDFNKNATPAEKFQEACWNGLLNGMFSEIRPYSADYREIFIWGIYSGKSYLLVDLADAPDTVESLFSIDPHLFLPVLDLS
jgi:hypothetical protein